MSKQRSKSESKPSKPMQVGSRTAEWPHVVDVPSSHLASVLDEAKQLVSTDRREDYGDIPQHYCRLAAAANSVMDLKSNPRQLEPHDFATIAILTKLVRQYHRGKRDNLIDIAGYAQVAAIIEGFDNDA